MYREARIQRTRPLCDRIFAPPAKCRIARRGITDVVCRTSRSETLPRERERRSGTQGAPHDGRVSLSGFDQSPVRLEQALGLGLRVLHRLLGRLRAGERRLQAVVERLGDALVVVRRQLGHRVLQLVARDRRRRESPRRTSSSPACPRRPARTAT